MNKSIIVEPNLHSQLKKHCIDKNISMKNFVAKWIVSVTQAKQVIQQPTKQYEKIIPSTHTGSRVDYADGTFTDPTSCRVREGSPAHKKMMEIKEANAEKENDGNPLIDPQDEKTEDT